jgi:hypothetical protein
MKNFVLILSVLITSFYSKADQHQIVSEENAMSAVQLLYMQSDVIAWCDCCGDEDYMKYILVEDAYYEYASEEGNDCYVFLSGTDEYGNPFNEAIDLAYIFIADGDEAVRLSSYMGLETEPCSGYIGYYDAYPFYADYEQEYTYDEELPYVEEDSYSSEDYYDENFVYEEYVSLLGFECGDFCHLMYIDSEGIETSGIIDESILPDGFIVDSEYGYIMSGYYDGAMARIEYTSTMVDYGGGTSYPELVITNFELVE